MAFQLNINKKTVSVDAAPETPLLWIVRDKLDLKGTKFGCGEGVCGACTILLNGRPVRSCQTTLSAAVGQQITTIEGLSMDGSHPVQVAWQQIDVAQCGYCQAGQMLTAAALLSTTPHPTDQQIDAAMSNNICRCGTYTRIRQAIHQAANANTTLAAIPAKK